MGSFEELVQQHGGTMEPAVSAVGEEDIASSTETAFDRMVKKHQGDSTFDRLVAKHAPAEWSEVAGAILPMGGALLRSTMAGAGQAIGEQGEIAAPAGPKIEPDKGLAEAIGGLFGYTPKADKEADKEAMETMLSYDPLTGGAPPIPQAAREALVRESKEIGDRARKDLEAATPKNMTFWQEAVTTAGVSAVHVGAVAIPALLLRSPGLVGAGAGTMVAAQSYDEARAKGLDPGPAFRLSVLKGMMEGATEAWSAKALLKDTTLFNKFVNFMVRELPGENATEIGQLFADRLYGLEDEVTIGDIAHTLALTSAATLITGGTIVPVVRGAEKLGSLPGGKQKESVELFEEDKEVSSRPPDVEIRSTAKPDTDMDFPFEDDRGSLPTIEVEEGELTDVGREELSLQEDLARRERRALSLAREIQQKANEPVDTTETKQRLEESGLNIEELSTPVVDYSHQIVDEMREVRVSDSANLSQVGKTVRDAKIQPGQVVEAWSPEQTPQQTRELRRVRDSIQAWVREFAPNAKVVLIDSEVAEQIQPVKRRRSGWAGVDKWGTHYISVDVRNLDSLARFHTSSHESGHVIMNEHWKDADPMTQLGLIKAYQGYLRDTTQGSLGQWLERWGDPHWEAQMRAAGWGEALDNPNTRALDFFDQHAEGQEHKGRYYLNFDEFAAQQFVRYARTREAGKAPVRGFWEDLYQKLKGFFEKHVKRFQPDATFAAWFEQLSELSHIQRVSQNVLEVRAADLIAGEQGGTKLADVVAAERVAKVQQELGIEFDPTLAAKYNGFIRRGFTLLQIGRENQHIPGVLPYLDATRNWSAYKSRWLERANKRAEQWHVSKAMTPAFNKALFEMTLDSFQKGRKLTPAEKEAHFTAAGVTEETHKKLYENIQQDFQAAVGDLMEVRRAEAERAFRNDPAKREEALAEIEAQQQEMMSREYFPLQRFGQYFVRIVARRDTSIQGQRVKKGGTIQFETYEREEDMQRRRKQLGASSHDVMAGKLSETAQTFLGMPPQLIDSLSSRLGLDESQRKELEMVKFETSPAHSFTKRLLQRKGTRGFSFDGPRVYANYFQHFAGHIARLKHQQALLDAKGMVADFAKKKSQVPGQSNVKERGLADHLDRHFDYIMNPGNELANLRAFGFLWYLAYMPKSAFVNLTQVPTVTYPYLAARYGDGQTVTELTRAMKDLRQGFLQTQGKGSKLEPELRKALTRGVEAGFIDESLATDLAALSEGSNLQRLAPGTFLRSERGAKMLREASYYGAWLFQKAEKVNRVQTFIAAFRLARKQGMDGGAAYRQARNAVESTQYEYAQWNRPEWFRGKKSVVFLFMQHLQNTLYFAARDKGAARFWIAMFLLGGVSGLPFAEDVMKAIDWGADWIKRLTGWSDVKTDSKQYMRDMAEEIGVNPDLLLHGLSRKSLGLGWAADSVGVPFPSFDLSGSLSYGRVIPGLEPALSLTSPQGNFRQEFPKMVTDVGGAFISIPMAVMQAAADDNPDNFKRWERAMPSAARSLAKAYQYARDEAATSRRWAPIVRFDPHDRIHNAEIIGQALGFRPTRVAERQSKDWVRHSHAQFYETRRRQLMQDFDYAMRLKDKEAKADVLKAIRAYNDSVPHSSLKISSKAIKASVQSRKRGRKLEEQGLPRSRRNIPLYQGIN